MREATPFCPGILFTRAAVKFSPIVIISLRKSNVKSNFVCLQVYITSLHNCQILVNVKFSVLSSFMARRLCQVSTPVKFWCSSCKPAAKVKFCSSCKFCVNQLHQLRFVKFSQQLQKFEKAAILEYNIYVRMREVNKKNFWKFLHIEI